jgi:hypothetical protein
MDQMSQLLYILIKRYVKSVFEVVHQSQIS